MSKPRTCECGPWKIVRRPGADYCPDLTKCVYVQTKLKIRRLQELPFRTLRMILPSDSAAVVGDTTAACLGSAALDAKQPAENAVVVSVLQAPNLSQVGDGTGTVIWGASINVLNFFAGVCRASNSLIFSVFAAQIVTC
jgi:hypothetical protein